MSSSANVERRLKEKIAGETVMSENPGGTLRKWREDFGVPQKKLGESLDVSSSVVSDYEGGRRSPGVGMVQSYIEGLIRIDKNRGSENIERYGEIIGAGFEGEAVKELREYRENVSLDDFLDSIGARTVTEGGSNQIQGYTLVDSVKSVTSMSHTKFTKLYGWSTERALVFTDLDRGETPLVAIRVTHLKPTSVVLHGIHETRLSELAPQIAEIEDINLSITNLPLDQVKKKLRKLDSDRQEMTDD